MTTIRPLARRPGDTMTMLVALSKTPVLIVQ